MSVLHMFLPVCEPARSEALAQLRKTRHLPRHLVKGIAIRHRDDGKLPLSADAEQPSSPAPSQAPTSQEAQPPHSPR